MADQPTEVTVASQTTPANTPLTDTTGARSVYDPPMTPAEASAAALAGQLNDMLAGNGVGRDSGGGVRRTITQTPGLPAVTWHTAALSYEIPLG
jgi:hypothetical protein